GALNHGQRGGGQGGAGDRARKIHARRDHPATHGRLHRRGAAQGQEEGGLIRRRWPVFRQSRITTSRSVPDSPPHASPGRPSIWRTFAFFLSLGKVVKVSVLGSKRCTALAGQSVAHTRSPSSTLID